MTISESKIEEMVINIDQCRICFDGEGGDNGTLVSPCTCSGSMKYVHPICLDKWIAASGSNRCEICNDPYDHPFDSVPPDERYPGLRSALTTLQKSLVADAIFVVIVGDMHRVDYLIGTVIILLACLTTAALCRVLFIVVRNHLNLF